MTHMQWLIALAEEHVRAFQALAAVVAVLFTLCGFIIGRVTSFWRMRRLIREHRELENSGVVVFEGHNLRYDPETRKIELRVVSWGGKHSLTELFHDAVLEAEVTAAARKREGFLRLAQPGQKLAMIGFEEAVTGNNQAVNMDRLMGRRDDKDEVIMCPVTWPGIREAHIIRVVLIDSAWMDRLADMAVIEEIVVSDPRHVQRPQWLHAIALAWQQERYKPWEVACIWNIKI